MYNICSLPIERNIQNLGLNNHKFHTRRKSVRSSRNKIKIPALSCSFLHIMSFPRKLLHILCYSVSDNLFQTKALTVIKIN